MRLRDVPFMLALAACSDDKGVCTLLGCESGAQFELAIPESELARVTGGTIDVCFTSICRTYAIDALPSPNSLSYLPPGPPMDPGFEVSLWRTNPTGVLEILIVLTSDQPALFHDGDLYTIKVVASDGGVLLDRGWSVYYRTSQPNGPACEPTCRSDVNNTER